jgi:hypothetical protein
MRIAFTLHFLVIKGDAMRLKKREGDGKEKISSGFASLIRGGFIIPSYEVKKSY